MELFTLAGSSALKIGHAFAIFQSFGNVDVFNDKLNTIYNGTDSTYMHSL